jgi:hypothetical protein
MPRSEIGHCPSFITLDKNLQTHFHNLMVKAGLQKAFTHALRPNEQSVRPSVIRNIGITLFLLSFVVPPGASILVPTMNEHVRDYQQPFWGWHVFLNTPGMIFFLPLLRGPPIDNGFTPYEIFIRVILMGAWLANFTVFFRLGRSVAWAAILLPWTAFIFWFGLVAGFVPFYFWALGITFIHVSRFLRSRANQSPEPASDSESSSAFAK